MLVPTSLNGLGNTYLDDRFLMRLQRFIAEAQRQGITLHFNEAFRTTEYQVALRNNPRAITPAQAGGSLHEAGFAVDINYSSLRNIPGGLTGDQQRRIILAAARAAGIQWGGNFSTPDRPHFYYDPGGNRQELIRNAQEAYRRLQGLPPGGGS